MIRLIVPSAVESTAVSALLSTPLDSSELEQRVVHLQIRLVRVVLA